VARIIATLAREQRLQFVQAEVIAIDRDGRRVVTSGGTLEYDWLVLAVGIRYDYAPWFGDDSRRCGARVAQVYPAGFVADELDALKQKVGEFKGGDFVMTIPPGPYRCPPAPYERAVMIAWLFKQKNIKGKLIIVDPGRRHAGLQPRLRRPLQDQVVHLTHAAVKSVDPFNKTIATEFDDLRFDDAILMPAQAAGGLVGRRACLHGTAEGRRRPGPLDPVASPCCW
jgi:hypothetical protein